MPREIDPKTVKTCPRFGIFHFILHFMASVVQRCLHPFFGIKHGQKYPFWVILGHFFSESGKPSKVGATLFDAEKWENVAPVFFHFCPFLGLFLEGSFLTILVILTLFWNTGLESPSGSIFDSKFARFSRCNQGWYKEGKEGNGSDWADLRNGPFWKTAKKWLNSNFQKCQKWVFDPPKSRKSLIWGCKCGILDPLFSAFFGVWPVLADPGRTGNSLHCSGAFWPGTFGSWTDPKIPVFFRWFLVPKKCHAKMSIKRSIRGPGFDQKWSKISPSGRSVQHWILWVSTRSKYHRS